MPPVQQNLAAGAGGGDVYQSGTDPFCILKNVLQAQDVCVVNIRSGREVLYGCGAVEYRIYPQIIHFFEALRVGNFSLGDH